MISKQQAEAGSTTTATTSDPRGIPGWDKVGQLAEFLVQLTGIAVSCPSYIDLYNALDAYDKRTEGCGSAPQVTTTTERLLLQ